MPNKHVTPLPVSPGETVFDEPWQAQVLAMADLLIQSKRITANDWSSALGEQLKTTQTVSDDLNDAKENYYKAALIALTTLMDSKNIVSQQQLHNREDDWKSAYLSTPHGKPVRLNAD